MDKKADVSSVSPSSEQLEELWIVWGSTGEYNDEKTIIN